MDGLRDPQDILDETSATGHHSRRVSRVEPAQRHSGSPSATLDLLMVQDGATDQTQIQEEEKNAKN